MLVLRFSVIQQPFTVFFNAVMPLTVITGTSCQTVYSLIGLMMYPYETTQ